MRGACAGSKICQTSFAGYPEDTDRPGTEPSGKCRGLCIIRSDKQDLLKMLTFAAHMVVMFSDKPKMSKDSDGLTTI
jgi:hypothetical protein